MQLRREKTLQRAVHRDPTMDKHHHSWLQLHMATHAHIHTERDGKQSQTMVNIRVQVYDVLTGSGDDSGADGGVLPPATSNRAWLLVPVSCTIT